MFGCYFDKFIVFEKALKRSTDSSLFPLLRFKLISKRKLEFNFFFVMKNICLYNSYIQVSLKSVRFRNRLVWLNQTKPSIKMCIENDFKMNVAITLNRDTDHIIFFVFFRFLFCLYICMCQNLISAQADTSHLPAYSFIRNTWE